MRDLRSDKGFLLFPYGDATFHVASPYKIILVFVDVDVVTVLVSFNVSF